MKHLLATSISIALLSLGIVGCSEKQASETVSPDAFVTIQGPDLIKPDGSKLFIMGTNLGNWLNPEGYMFRFNKTNSGRFINEMFCQLVGPDFTADFWKAFKDNYVTREDIQFIKNTGANTIRLPFHYKLFTDEDYMGLTVNQDGFARVDTMLPVDKQVIILMIATAIPGCSTASRASSFTATSGARLPIITRTSRSSWVMNCTTSLSLLTSRM